jgi:hypothetical protein
MDRRRQFLLAALGLMTTGYLLDAAYRRWYEQPLALAEQQTTALERELQQAQLEARRQQKRLPALDTLHGRSLPSNVEIAVTEYRSWLLQVIAQSGLQQPSLDSGNPARLRNLYQRIDFTLRTRGTLSQLTAFMQQFYATAYLHKIRSLSLTPTSDGTLDISLTIETLGIPAVASESQLPEPPPHPGRSADQDAYRLISQRNLFRQGEPPAASIKLSAITLDAQRQRQVWLSFLKTGQTHILAEGEQLSLEGSLLKVRSIQAETAALEIDGEARTVAIGHTLAEGT